MGANIKTAYRYDVLLLCTPEAPTFGTWWTDKWNIAEQNEHSICREHFCGAFRSILIDCSATHSECYAREGKCKHPWNRWNGTGHIFVVNRPADIDMCAQLFIITEFTEMRSKRITGECEYGECAGRRTKRIRYVCLLHCFFFIYFNWYRYPFQVPPTSDYVGLLHFNVEFIHLRILVGIKQACYRLPSGHCWITAHSPARGESNWFTTCKSTTRFIDEWITNWKPTRSRTRNIQHCLPFPRISVFDDRRRNRVGDRYCWCKDLESFRNDHLRWNGSEIRGHCLFEMAFLFWINLPATKPTSLMLSIS